MRRKDREITERKEILTVVEGCEVLRLGLFDPDDSAYPYIVPVNFAYEEKDGKLLFYFHGAQTGRKFELMQRVGVCSFEMDCRARVVTIAACRNITTRYESAMGKGKLRLLEGEEKLHALTLVADRPEVSRGFDWDRNVVPRTAVWEIEVSEIVGKANRDKE